MTSAAYDLDTWREALRRRVKALYATMRHLWEADAFLVSPPGSVATTATRRRARHPLWAVR